LQDSVGVVDKWADYMLCSTRIKESLFQPEEFRRPDHHDMGRDAALCETNEYEVLSPQNLQTQGWGSSSTKVEPTFTM